MKVLIIDNSEKLRSQLKEILISEFYAVDIVSTVKKAGEYLKAKIPSIIFLKADIPGYNAYEFCSSLKSDKILSRVPVIFYSEKTSDIDRPGVYNSGGADFITTPFSGEEILARIKYHEKLNSNRNRGDDKKVLSESEERYRNVLENATEMITQHDIEGNFVFANHTTEKISGYKVDELIGKSFIPYIHPDDLEDLMEDHMRLISGQPRESRFRIFHKNGHVVYLETQSFPYYEDDIITGTFIFSRDVTDRAVAEEALQISEENYRRIFNSFVDVYFETDMEGNIIEVSPSIERYTGYRREEVIGKPAISFYTDPERREEYIQELSERGYVHGFEIDFFKKDGQIISFSSTSRIEKDSEGNTIKVIGVLHDITEQKKAEEERKKAEDALRESEEKYRTIFNSYIDVYVETSMEGKIIEVSPSIEAFGGYKREEFIGKSAADLYADPEKRTELIREISEKGYVNGFDTDLICKDGHTVSVSISSRLEMDTDGNPKKLVGIIHDISERKKAEEEKNKLKEQLLQSQKLESVGRLAGGVAHDFNNMLNVIIGHSDMALFSMSDEDPLRKRIEEISKAAHRSADLTRQLLAFARHQTVEPKVLDLNNTIKSMLNMLGRLIGEDIELIWKPYDESVFINIDPSQIDQMLANLAVNARDAIEGVGSISIETALKEFDEEYCSRFTDCTPGRFAMISVSDTGKGMDEETRNNIFEPFFTTKEKGKGTGLGLATVYGIVKQNFGFINVYSEPGQGSIFKIYLPSSEKRSGIDDYHAGIIPEIMKGDETILFVEDEVSILEVGREILEALGYSVLAVSAPRDAVALAEKYGDEIHLLITDVVMPEMNGRELSDQILSIHRDIKTLYISGYTSNIIEHRGVLDEGVKFLQKPFTKKELSEKVREVLEM